MPKKVFSFLLILLFAKAVNASTIPFEGDLNDELSAIQIKLDETANVNIKEALSLGRALYSSSSEASLNVRGWALNTYAWLLLENDSISRAEKLLRDSINVDWTAVDGWIQDHHSLNSGRVLAYKGMNKEAESLFRKTEAKCTDLAVIGQLKQALAETLTYQGKADQSLVKWYEALEILEELADSAEIIDSYLGIGIVWFERNDLEQAQEDISLFHQYNLRTENEKKVALAISVLALIDYQNGNLEQSIEKSLEGYNIRKRIGDLKGQGESLNNLALGYMGMKNWNQALQYLEQAVQIKTQANDLTQNNVILNNIGHCHSKLGRWDQALKYFNLALQKSKENGQLGDVLISYENIIKVQTKMTDYRSAFQTQSEFVSFKDSLAEAEKMETINELEVKYETEKKEGEIMLLQQEKTIITNRWLTLALGMFLAIIITVLIIDNQKRRHRQEKELLLKEDELQKAELKNMADMLEFNQNKLSLYMENLLKKNELVGQLESRLKDTVDFASPKTESDKKLIKNFTAVRILTDEDWAEFKTLFNGVHEGLLDQLLATYNGLTLGEQRLFLLMKLSLSTKEIANILGVSPESVKKGRYRLKKKLGVEEESTLQEFIKAF